MSVLIYILPSLLWSSAQVFVINVAVVGSIHNDGEILLVEYGDTSVGSVPAFSLIDAKPIAAGLSLLMWTRRVDIDVDIADVDKEENT